jgi:hypothetical protein
MKIRVRGLAAIIVGGALCLTLPAGGQNSITLTGVNGSTSSDNGGNLINNEDVYTGIYYSTVDGTANTPTICDDFNHNVNLGQLWNATALNTSSLNASNIGQTAFGATIGLVGYAEVATLVAEIFTLNNGKASSFGTGTNVTGTDLSEAIWAITTPGGISGISANAAAIVSWVEGLYGSSSAAQSFLNKLNLWILTPSPYSSSSPQEFWAPGGPSYTVPEGGSALLYLLLAGIACLGAVIMNLRSQAATRETA